MAEPDAMVQLETALMARLGATASATSTDPQLAALLPGGVYSRSGGGDAYPFLTLGLVRQDDDHTFARAYRHRFRYNIAVTSEGDSIDAASAALQRVYELLQDCDEDPTMPTMEDFKLGFSRRAGRVGTTPTSIGQTYQRVVDEWRFEAYPNG